MTGNHSRSVRSTGGHPAVGWWQPPRSAGRVTARRTPTRRLLSRHRIALATTRHRAIRRRRDPVVVPWLRRLSVAWTFNWLDRPESGPGELLVGSRRRTHRHRRVRSVLPGSFAAILLLPLILVIVGQPDGRQPTAAAVPVIGAQPAHPLHLQPLPRR